MRLVELSDHPGGLLREIHRERAAGTRRWRGWIGRILAVLARRRAVPRRPVPTGQEQSIAAGMAGERQVAADLAVVLGDDWVLFRGYRNGRGEIDHLLLGPGGLFAIEVKYHNATVYITGDDWRFEKFDRYGNRVEQGRVEDRTGRSPSMQVNESADELARFLRSRGQTVSVTRVVILNHPRSRVGSQRKPTVRVTTSSRDIIDLVRGSPVRLTDGRVAQLASLIERDHRFHEARRPGDR